MSSVNTYAPADVTLTLGGYPLTGWNTISLKKNQTGYTPIRGIRGKNTRSRSSDTSATITFSCLQTGEANDIMSDIHRQDLATGNGRIALLLKDTSGSSLFHTSEAFIVDFPETTYSGEFEYRIWTIYCLTSEADWNSGGNLLAPDSLYSKVTSFVGDSLSSAADAVGSIL